MSNKTSDIPAIILIFSLNQLLSQCLLPMNVSKVRGLLEGDGATHALHDGRGQEGTARDIEENEK